MAMIGCVVVAFIHRCFQILPHLAWKESISPSCSLANPCGNRRGVKHDRCIRAVAPTDVTHDGWKNRKNRIYALQRTDRKGVVYAYR
jgi:hypothetical protein